MKIKITYQHGEEKHAQSVAEHIKKTLKNDYFIKENQTETHKPFYHIYLNLRSYLILDK